MDPERFVHLNERDRLDPKTRSRALKKIIEIIKGINPQNIKRCNTLTHEGKIIMKNYIGTKAVKAREMSAEQASVLLNREIPTENAERKEDKHPGYIVRYPDGHDSWCPKKVFEAAYTEMGGENNTVVEEDVENAIASTYVTTLTPHDKPVTFVEVQMRNGFTIRETTTCVDPENYSEEIGAEICMKRIKDKIWMLLGFMLQQGLSGTCK